jgi:catabolite regulation protein CreA
MKKSIGVGLSNILPSAVMAFALMFIGSAAHSADEPDLIFKRSTVFKWLTPNDKLATYGLDDPEVDGVACHFTVPERGGFKGWVGVAEEVSDISLACRQIGPIRFKAKFEQGEDMSASGDRCSSKRCRSFEAATPNATCSCTWSILIGSSRDRRRIPPPRSPSCRGGTTIRFSGAEISSRNRRRRLRGGA